MEKRISGSAVGASVTGATTLASGYAVKYMYENNIEIDAEQLKSIYVFSKTE